VTGISTWWDGIPGLDWRYAVQPGADGEFADRMAALACAMRLTGSDPSVKLPRSLVNLAESFLDHFQSADTPLEGYVRRLTVAMVCTAWEGSLYPHSVIAAAEQCQRYLMMPPGKRGGWI
jgi:hypothetical protein